MTTALDIIERFGGRKQVAEHFGISEKAVYQWEARGTIPGAYHLPFLAWAQESGTSLTAEELLGFAKRGAA